MTLPFSEHPSPSPAGAVAGRQPKVTFALVVHDQGPYLARCLEAMARTLPSSLDFEVLVVDNGSTDMTSQVLTHVQGDIRAVRVPTPVPAGQALDAALGPAAGAYVCLLDVTRPPEGEWIEPLVRALDEVASLDAVLPSAPRTAGWVLTRAEALRAIGGFAACDEGTVLDVVAVLKAAKVAVATVEVAAQERAPEGDLRAPIGHVVAPATGAAAIPPGAVRSHRKVLHVGLGHPPNWINCGPVIYVHTLAKAQRAAGDDVIVLAASDEKTPGAPPYAPSVVRCEGVPYVLLTNRPVSIHDFWRPGREVHDPHCRQAVEQVLGELRPDVVHIHNLVGLSFDVVAAARASGARVVLSLHNYFPLCSRDDLFFADAEHCAGPTQRSCARCLGTMRGDAPYQDRHRAAIDALNSCDALLAVSSRVADIYRSHGVRQDLLSVDRIGSLTAARMWESFGRARAASGTRPSEHLRLVFFGSVIPRKGLVTAIQAMGLVRHPERLELHVLGNPPADQAPLLHRCMEALPPAHAARVSFDGPFLQTTLDTILARMDVAVLPPRWEDNGPQTVIEALGAGLPVVGTAMGGVVDFVQHEGNGLLVPEGDPIALAAALDRLVDEPGLVSRLRAGITGPVTLDAHVRSLEQYYRHTAPAVAPAPLEGALA